MRWVDDDLEQGPTTTHGFYDVQCGVACTLARGHPFAEKDGGNDFGGHHADAEPLCGRWGDDLVSTSRTSSTSHGLRDHACWTRPSAPRR